MDTKNLKIAYIGGGSMAWARTFMTDLALEPGICGEICLYDINTDAAKRNETIGKRISQDSRALSKWRYTTARTISQALTDSDFIAISILPGTFEHMRSDVHLPERLGVYQSVGDTAGPGGAVRALRTIPIFTEFARAIEKYAPNAWVINYTNPMSLCMRALYHAFPQIKAFGCCHEVFGTQSLLASMLQRETGGEIPRRDIQVNVLGLNHFTWFDKAMYNDTDLMPMFSRFADDNYHSGFETENDSRLEEVFRGKNRVKFDLYRKYGLIAAAGDRHLAEFMPGDIYLKDPETAKSWGFMLTSVDWRIGDRQRKAQCTNLLVQGKESLDLKPSGEEGIILMKALCGLGDMVSNVNLPNSKNQISNMPKDTIVETNALFSKDSVEPVNAGSLPEQINDLFTPHVMNQAEILNAALTCDRDTVVRVFERDPLLSGRCDLGDLRKLADDMINNTIDVLPEGWK